MSLQGAVFNVREIFKVLEAKLPEAMQLPSIALEALIERAEKSDARVAELEAELKKKTKASAKVVEKLTIEAEELTMTTPRERATRISQTFRMDMSLYDFRELIANEIKAAIEEEREQVKAKLHELANKAEKNEREHPDLFTGGVTQRWSCGMREAALIVGGRSHSSVLMTNETGLASIEAGHRAPIGQVEMAVSDSVSDTGRPRCHEKDGEPITALECTRCHQLYAFDLPYGASKVVQTSGYVTTDAPPCSRCGTITVSYPNTGNRYCPNGECPGAGVALVDGQRVERVRTQRTGGEK